MLQEKANDDMVTLKGQGSLLRLLLSVDGPLEIVLSQARKALDKASSMIGDIGIVLETGSRCLDGISIVRILEDLIWPMSLNVKYWKSEDKESLLLLRRSGFSLEDDTSSSENICTGEPLVVDRSLRSGQKVVHDGDVLILGSVNDGSEVLASGNICVFGKLQGLAHAGSQGDDRRFIAVDSFMARQVRIGCRVSNEMAQSEQHWWGRPVIISIERGAFLVTERK